MCQAHGTKTVPRRTDRRVRHHRAVQAPGRSRARGAVVVAVLVLVAVLLAALAVARSRPDPSVALSLSQGISGTVVTVSGTGFPPRSGGRVRAGGPPAPVRTDDEGAFARDVMVGGDPQQVVDVRADVGGDADAAPFRVGASLWPSGHAIGLGVAVPEDGSARDVVAQPDLTTIYAALDAPISAEELSGHRVGDATLVVTLEPYDFAADTTDQPGYRLSRVIDGSRDEALTAWARAVEQQRSPTVIRFAHEMNGTWYPWSEGVNGNRPGEYVQAWRHAVDLFRREGASNAQWAWSPNVVEPGTAPLAGLYPGDDYVDVVALDGYNWGTSREDTRWRSPSQLFDATLADVRALAPGKPVVIGETASSEDGGAKAEWIQELFVWATRQPDLQALTWFDHDKETDWRTTSSPAAARAFERGAATLARRSDAR